MRDTNARSLVTIMLIIAVMALLLRVAIEQIIKFNISQNESNAAATLKLVSAALESYAKDKRGVFPANLTTLTKSSPPYLDNEFIGRSAWKGYSYSCPRLEATGYSCSATPLKCKITGNLVYVVTTGGILVSEECRRE